MGTGRSTTRSLVSAGTSAAPTQRAPGVRPVSASEESPTQTTLSSQQGLTCNTRKCLSALTSLKAFCASRFPSGGFFLLIAGGRCSPIRSRGCLPDTMGQSRGKSGKIDFCSSKASLSSVHLKPDSRFAY